MNENEHEHKAKPVASETQPTTPVAKPVLKPVPSKPRPDGRARERMAAIILLVVLSVSFGFVGGYFGDQASKDSRQSADVQRQTIDNESNLITSIAKDVGQSVVSVEVTSQAATNSVFGPRSAQQTSAGTGIIIDSNGIIITNRHVIPASASSVSVTLSDGTELDNVEVIGRTNDSDPLDVAFLKVKDKKGKDLKAAKLGDSSKMQVGERVIAIGNALGQFQNTVTTGVISGYGRSVEAGDNSGSETLQNLFQTDAAINEGNSGGPLVNVNGEVIGINTAVAGDAENIGFSIPINDVKGLVTGVLQEGKLVRPYLGVRYITLNDDVAYQNNLSTKRGAFITASGGQAAVVPGSPADKAGLKDGDIITKVDNDTIDEKNSLISILGRHKVGDTVKLTIVRDGKDQTINATLEAVPQG